ncbi:redoxin domain-containing protein [Flavobacterium aquidurense]|uniref:redoxin domain-containing protein n=1 Tax=Flavobacterium aquidurense TaxID=362413 RepID=UPI00370F931C
MKSKYAFLIVLSFMVSVLSAKSWQKQVQNKGYLISGSVKGLDTGLVKITRPDYTGGKEIVIDSMQIKNGKFTFKGKVDYVDIVNLIIDNKYIAERGFFLDNSIMTLEIDLTKVDRTNSFNLKVTGSKYQEEFLKQTAIGEKIMAQEKYKKIDRFMDKMRAAYQAKDTVLMKQYETDSKAYEALVNERQSEYQNSKINYVKMNPSSVVAPNVLGFQFSEGRMSKEQMTEIYPLFQKEAKKTAMYKYYAKIYEEIFTSLGIGGTVPDFTLNTVNGATLTLSKVNSKYKLVDFWASWCVPCRKSFPHLSELYKKYQSKGLEIIGIGTSDEEAKWRKAIMEDKTLWNHVFDPGTSRGVGKVAATYGVPFLPTTFLIDNNGKIILRNPTADQLDQKLAELLGE